MPDTRIKRPLPALAGEFDASIYAGAVLFTRTDNGVTSSATLPSTSSRYWDVLAHLHGYGSKNGQTFADLINAAYSGGGTFTAGIDSDDRFYIENNSADFTIQTENNDWSLLGFNRVDLRASANGAAYRVTAQNPWRRGVLQLPTGMMVTEHAAGGDVDHGLLWELPRVQCLPVWLRKRGVIGDSDDVWLGKTVEDIDPDGLSRWLVEADGRVSVSYYENQGFSISTSSWWTRLGGDGLEIPINDVGGRKRLTTANPCPCFLASKKGYVSLRRSTRMRETRQLMTDGSIVSSGLPVLRHWNLTLRLEGPASGFTRDQEDHLRQWWSYARHALTFYPSWGDGDYTNGAIDTRRHVDRVGTSHSFQFTLLQTSGADHPDVHFHKRQGGRLLVRLHPNDDQSRRESYAEEKDVYQDIDFVLSDDPSR